MHHIEKHIRKNQLKVGWAWGRGSMPKERPAGDSCAACFVRPRSLPHHHAKHTD